MTGVLDGYLVVEVANWLAAPSAGAVLADMGAKVIKIEQPNGDVWRWFRLSAAGYTANFPLNMAFETDNRGKRSVTVDLENSDGRAVVLDLVRRADVFLTNLLPERRERYGLRPEDLQPLNERLIYASFSGYGSTGDDRNRLGFDYAAFWSRSGIMGLLGEPGMAPVLQRGGMGDHSTCMAITTGILAALLDREKTGRGQVVETSLLSMGLWVLGVDVSAALYAKEQPRKPTRQQPANPIWNTYLTKDGRWILLVMPLYQPYWPNVARAIGRPELATDPHYATLDAAQARAGEIVGMLESAFATRTLAEWRPILDEHRVIWALVQEMPEVIADAQARAMECFVPVDHPTIGRFETVAAPFQLSDAPLRPQGAAPEVGQHTEEVLLELGYDWDRISALREQGALG